MMRSAMDQKKIENFHPLQNDAMEAQPDDGSGPRMSIQEDREHGG